MNYLRINHRLELSRAGSKVWTIYMDGEAVDSEGGYEHMEDAAMAAVLYFQSVK